MIRRSNLSVLHFEAALVGLIPERGVVQLVALHGRCRLHCRGVLVLGLGLILALVFGDLGGGRPRDGRRLKIEMLDVVVGGGLRSVALQP